MVALKQQDGVASIAGQKMQMSKPRVILTGVMALTAFYVVWGIVKVIL
ncbi:MAG: hypothetical protein FD134_266 [Gallionellaceae bacterium]|nr:MAG: hypothetical protein FD134_266 [Gallionellaceae bacterium]